MNFASLPTDPSYAAEAVLDDGTGAIIEAFPDEREVYPQGEFVQIKNLMVDGGDQFGVSAVAFDRQEELLWMGNAGVSSSLQGML